MAFSYSFTLFIFAGCFYIISDCFPFEDDQDLKVGQFSILGLCSNVRQSRDRKLLCLFCKGLDPSCFFTSTPQTTLQTSSPSTTLSSTTPTTSEAAPTDK